MTTKFKVGDILIEKESGESMKIESINGNYVKSFPSDIGCENWSMDYLEKNFIKKSNKKVKPPKFILQYEIDEDPIEEFQTLKEVKNRISELAIDEEAHSFKVYQVTKLIIPEVSVKEVAVIKGL